MDHVVMCKPGSAQRQSCQKRTVPVVRAPVAITILFRRAKQKVQRAVKGVSARSEWRREVGKHPAGSAATAKLTCSPLPLKEPGRLKLPFSATGGCRGVQGMQDGGEIWQMPRAVRGHHHQWRRPHTPSGAGAAYSHTQHGRRAPTVAVVAAHVGCTRGRQEVRGWRMLG